MKLVISAQEEQAKASLRFAMEFAETMRFCYFCERHGTREEHLRGRWSMAQMMIWRQGLMALGLAEWKDPFNKRLGWRLTANMDEILFRFQQDLQAEILRMETPELEVEDGRDQTDAS